MSSDEPVIVARIARAHGVRGALLLDLETDHAEALFQPGRRLSVVAGSAESTGFTVRSGRPHGRRWLVEFEEVADRTGADRVRGALLAVARAELPDLEPDGVLLHDLIGLTLVDRGEPRGPVTNVFDLPAGPMLEVTIGEARRLVPLQEDIVDRIDVEGGAVYMRLPEGLLEL